MINKRVDVDNSNMLERVIDNEIFGGLVKGVLKHSIEAKINAEDLLREDNLEIKIAQVKKDLMKQICLADDSSDEEFKHDPQEMIDNRQDKIFDEIFKEDD